MSSTYIEKKTTTTDDVYIWCAQTVSQFGVKEKMPDKNKVYSPPVDESRLHRLPYSYSEWKTSPDIIRQLTPCEHALIMRLLMTIEQICREHRLTFMMINGTLLGSWRHHDIIPWDDDADILMPIQDQPHFIKALDESKNSIVKYMPLPFSNRPERSFKVFFQHTPCAGNHCAWNFPSVDIIVYDSNATHLWFSENPSIQIPLKDVFPLVMRPLAYLWLPAPRVPQNIFYFDAERECTSSSYNHRFEASQVSIQRKCSDLYDIYPFVKRNVSNKSVETLILNRTVIHTIMYSTQHNFPRKRLDLMIQDE
jgi:hypothetical protein